MLDKNTYQILLTHLWLSNFIIFPLGKRMSREKNLIIIYLNLLQYSRKWKKLDYSLEVLQMSHSYKHWPSYIFRLVAYLPFSHMTGVVQKLHNPVSPNLQVCSLLSTPDDAVPKLLKTNTPLSLVTLFSANCKRSLMATIERIKRTFFPQAIKLLNTDMSILQTTSDSIKSCLLPFSNGTFTATTCNSPVRLVLHRLHILYC